MTTHALHLDIGHAGKPGRNDPGAVLLDASGAVVRTEVQVVTAYAAAAAERMIERGAQVFRPTLPAWYGARQAEACRIARKLPKLRHSYVACHFNAGTARHGIIGHDARSAGGKRAAEDLAAAMRIRCPWLSAVQVHAVAHDSSEPWQRNMYATISGIFVGPSNIVGLCFEPGFLGRDEHCTAEALRIIGQTLGDVAAGWAVVEGGDTPPPPERQE
jgi:hypothetical protein